MSHAEADKTDKIKLKLVMLRPADGMVVHQYVYVEKSQIKSAQVYDRVLEAYARMPQFGGLSFVEADLPNGKPLISQMSLRKFVESNLSSVA